MGISIMKRVLHIIPVEKFVDRAISLYEEAFHDMNDFYVFAYDEEANLKCLNSPQSSNIHFVRSDIKWWRDDFIDLNNYSTVVLHNLYSPANIFFANKVSKDINVVACIWGYEFYGENNFWNKDKYGSLTKKLQTKLNEERETDTRSKNRYLYLFERGCKYIVYEDYRYNNPFLKSKQRAFKRIDVIATHVKPDYKNVIQRFKSKSKWSHLSYYSFEDYNSQLSNSQLKKKILIGNSATFTNNHIDVFEIIKDKVKDFDVICPLNYGDEEYGRKIIELGTIYFGSKFSGLTDFLPLEEYSKLQAECSIVIMNHYRQQAAGNIIAALLMGSKVFMSNRSPLFEHFKTIGLHIYSIEDHLEDDNAFEQLNSTFAANNKAILKRYYSRKTIVNGIRDSISICR